MVRSGCSAPPAATTTGSASGRRDALSGEGLDELRSDLRERTGGTAVFRAVVYPEYAVVAVPVDATSQREESYYWDGDLDDGGSKGTSTQTRIDLADVDSRVLGRRRDQGQAARRGPDHAGTSSSTARARPRAPTTRAPTITAYASNDFSESASVELALDGTVVEPDVTVSTGARPGGPAQSRVRRRCVTRCGRAASMPRRSILFSS